MTTAMRLAATLSAAVVLVAGCGSGPGRANAAAIIDGRTISVDDIQSRVEKVVKGSNFAQQLQQQHKLDLLSRSILTREVSYELTAKAVQRENLQVDEAALAQRVAERGRPQELPPEAIEANLERATDAAFDPREVAKNELLMEALAKAYLTKLQVTFTGSLISGTEARRDAQDLAQKLAAKPADAQALVGQSQEGIPSFKLSLVNGVLIAQQAGFELATSPLISAQANTVVAFSLTNHIVQQTAAANGWLVGLVTERNLNAKLSQQEFDAVESLPVELLAKMGKRLVAQYIGDVKLEIGPRYGVWDPVGNLVAPRAEEVAGYQYAARAAKP